MPSAAVRRTVGDFIYYYYAKLVIAPSAGQTDNYAFIIDRYKRLRTGEIRISDYDREIGRMATQGDRCAFCSRRAKTKPLEIVPRALGGPVGIHNLVRACARCARSKGKKDLLQWWCDVLGRDVETIPRVPIALYLKLAYERHHVGFRLRKPCHDIRDIWRGGSR